MKEENVIENKESVYDPVFYDKISIKKMLYNMYIRFKISIKKFLHKCYNICICLIK